jgi:hypothetical protein
MAYIIFLIKTRHYQKLNKIGTTIFGCTNQDIYIFESLHNYVKKNKRNQNLKTLNGLLGRPENLLWPRDARARSHDSAAQIQAARPTSARGPRSVFRPRARLTRGARWSVREREGKKCDADNSPSVASPVTPRAQACSSLPCIPRGATN